MMLGKIDMKAIRVYVCSPLTGDIVKNVAYAVDVCGKLLIDGYYPICSHALTYTAYDLVSEDDALIYSKTLVKLCDVLYCPLPIVTSGMKKEIEYAVATNIPIVYNMYDLETLTGKW